MKLTPILFGTAAIGAIAFAAVPATAFPLTLTSLSGTITATANFGTNAETTTPDYSVKRFGLKDVMSLITNTVNSIAPEVVLPQKVSLAADVYDTSPLTYLQIGYEIDGTNILGTFTNYYTWDTRDIYLTNDSGFYFSLIDSNRDLASFSIGAVATKFKYGPGGKGSENDVILANLNLQKLKDQDGNWYAIAVTGVGHLEASRRANGIATIVLAVKGTGIGGLEDVITNAYGNYYTAHGICAGSFSFKGSGLAPEDGLPFSVYWWNNLRAVLPMARTNIPPIEPRVPAITSGLGELP